MSLRSLAKRVAAGGSSLALMVGATVLAFLVVEGLVHVADLRVTSLHRGLIKYGELQVYDPEQSLLTGPANADAVLFGHEHHFNSLGMRDRQPEARKPPGRVRVLLLGDSVVFGQGVAQDAMVAEVMRRRLGDAVDVVAAGVPGWRTVDEERFLRKHLERIEPDVVVLLYVENDNEPENPFLRARRPPGGIWPRLYRALLLHSRAFEWAAYVYQSRIAGPDRATLDGARAWDARVAAQGEPFGREDPGWIASRAALVRMQRSLADRGARLVVFLFDLGTMAAAAPIYQRFREMEEEGSMAMVPTRPFFAGQDPASLMNVPGLDPHPNARGHALLGDGMARMLQRSGALAPKQVAPSATRGPR